MPNTSRPTPPPLPPALQDLVGSDARWHELQGGRTNTTWRVEGHSSFVVKGFAPSRGNPFFPNDPTAEAAALAALKNSGLAPRLRGQFSAHGQDFIVYDFAPGTPLTSLNGPMFTALEQLHDIAPPDGLRRLDITPANLIKNGETFLSQCAGTLAQDIRHLRPAAIDIPAIPPVFLHGDAIPANAIEQDGHVTFIDWQCPAIGDPTYDLAIACAPSMQHVYGDGPTTWASVREALSAYSRNEIIARFEMLRPFYTYQMAAYCAWKAAQGETVYDEAARLELRELDRLQAPQSRPQPHHQA